MKNSFCDRLKKLRQQLDWSQDEISKKLGISSHTYLNYETGKRFPDTRFIERLVEISKVNPNWLFSKNSNTIDSISFLFPDNKEMKEFFYYFEMYAFVRYAALSSLEDMKIKYPHLFKEKVKINLDDKSKKNKKD